MFFKDFLVFFKYLVDRFLGEVSFIWRYFKLWDYLNIEGKGYLGFFVSTGGRELYWFIFYFFGSELGEIGLLDLYFLFFVDENVFLEIMDFNKNISNFKMFVFF